MPVRSVCLCVDRWPPFSKMHGPVRYAQSFARCMAARGLDVHILTPVSSASADFVENGYWVHPRVVRPFRVASRFQPGIGESWGLWRALELLRRAWPLELVEFSNGEGMGAVAALMSSLPVVIRVHTTAYEALSMGIGHTRLERGYARLERFAAHHADGRLTHSLAHRDQAALDYGLRPDAFAVVPHGLESLAAALPGPRKPRQVLAVGAASLRKGVDFFLDVASRLVQDGVAAQFVWVGHDNHSAPGGLLWREYAGAAYPQLKTYVRFESDVNDRQLANLYAESAAYFCTARYESFGLTLVEAMQTGTPIVAPDTGAMADIVGGDLAGLLYVPQSVEGAASQLKRLLTDPELVTRLGEQGRRRAKIEYSAETMTDRILVYYENAIQRTIRK